MLSFLQTYSLRSYSEIIDKTIKSMKERKTLSSNSDTRLYYMPGTYDEEKVEFEVKKPLLKSNSAFVKGVYLSEEKYAGIITGDDKEFNKISGSFVFFDEENNNMYHFSEIVEKSRGVSVYKIKPMSVFDTIKYKFADFSAPEVSIELPKLGCNIKVKIDYEESTKDNIITCSMGFCHDTPDEDDEKFKLDHITNLPDELIDILPLSDNWKSLLKVIGIGFYKEYKLRWSGLLEGRISYSIDSIVGAGIVFSLLEADESLTEDKSITLFKKPFFYLETKLLTIDIGAKVVFFIRSIEINILQFKLLVGLKGGCEVAIHYSFMNVFKSKSIFSFEIVRVEMHPTWYTNIFDSSALFSIKLTPGLGIPIFFNLTIPTIQIYFEIGLEIPIETEFSFNRLCNYNIESTLKSCLQFAARYKFEFRNKVLEDDELIIELFKLLETKIPFGGYREEYYKEKLEEQLKMNVTDLAMHVIALDDIILATHFILEVKNALVEARNMYMLDSNLYICTISEHIKYKQGANQLQIKYRPFGTAIPSFKVLDYYDFNISDPICSSKYKLPNGLTPACISNEYNNDFMLCCNKGKYKFCAAASKTKILNRYTVVYKKMTLGDYFAQHPYFVQNTFTLSDESPYLHISQNHVLYSVRVKCERCSSVQFISGSNMYGSIKSGNSFMPKLPMKFENQYLTNDYLNINFGLNASVTAIAICNNSSQKNCFAKCPNVNEYSSVKFDDQKGIATYSGSPSKPVNTYGFDIGMNYQVVSEISSDDYCSKSWPGEIKHETIKPGKQTITYEEIGDKYEIKTYIGKTYVPISRTKMISDFDAFLNEFGIKEENISTTLNTRRTMNTNNSYFEFTSNGSVIISKNIFNKNELKIKSIDVPSNYIEERVVVEGPFIPTDTEPKSKDDQSIAIIVIIVIAAIIGISLIGFIIYRYFKQKHDEDSSQIPESQTV